ncbi:hypothetical protein [Rathayibacter tritici]|uniref:hypothetical protein n=1 Tax=Rathayibacter tritici TaxID=33888 RepID=UPI0011AFEE90|nr:hypothetical protein [Rathayibacter tritici]
MMDALATPEGEAVRASVKVAPDTLLRVAHDEMRSADVGTGRGVTTAHQTVADRLGMSKRTVQRAREILLLLGFAAIVIKGRYLFGAERVAAQLAHGGRQLRMASTRALVMPRAALPKAPCAPPAPAFAHTADAAEITRSVENVHLPRRRPLTSTAPVKRHSPTRGEPRSGAASRQPRRRSDAKRSLTGRPAVPRSIELQRFAAALAQRIPWLARGVHIGHVVGMLDRTGIDVSEWSVEGLMFAMNTWLSRDGRQVPETFTSRNALGFYGWVIRRVITEHSQLDTARRVAATQRDADRARAAAERAAEAARLASIDKDEVDRIIAQMKTDQREFERAAREREMARKCAAAEAREELAARAAELRSQG